MYVSGPSQKTPEWYQERAVRLTGSNWYNILKGKEKPSGLIGCRHGSKFSEMCKAYADRYEKAALRSVQTFLNPFGLRIEEAKFYIPQSRPFLGATPDGIIVKDNDIDSVVKALKAMFHRAGSRRPHKIQTDRGLEFWNKHVKKLLREEGVLKLYSSHDQDTKASLAE